MFKKKGTIIAFCLSVFYAIGVLGGLYFSQKDMRLTEESTIEYSATVVEIKTWTASDDVYIEIITEEYGTALTVALAVSNQNGQDFLSDIFVGDTITFRIQERMKESLESKHMAIAVALRTARREYYSLEVYNEIMQVDASSAILAAVCLSCIALTVAVYCLFRLTGVWPFKEKRDRSKNLHL